MKLYRAVIRKGSQILTVSIEAEDRWFAANKLCLTLGITDDDILSLQNIGG